MDQYKKIMKIINTLYVVLNATEDKINNIKKVELLENANNEFNELITELKIGLNVEIIPPPINGEEKVELHSSKIGKLIRQVEPAKYEFPNVELPKHLQFITRDLNYIFTTLKAIEEFLDEEYTQTYSCNVLLVHQFRRNRIEFSVVNEFDESENFSEVFNDILLSNFDISPELLIDLIMQTGTLQEDVEFNGLSLVHYEQ